MDGEPNQSQENVAEPDRLKERRGATHNRLSSRRRIRDAKWRRLDCAGLMHEQFSYQKRERPSVSERTLFISEFRLVEGRPESGVRHVRQRIIRRRRDLRNRV